MAAYTESHLQMNSTMILCIEEFDFITENNPIDNRMFIGYDETGGFYYVRGKRQDTSKTDYPPYAFRFYSVHKLEAFIKFSVNNICSIILYNYNNIDHLEDSYSNDLTYEFFEEMIDSDYIISAYDNLDINDDANNLRTIIKMIGHEKDL